MKYTITVPQFDANVTIPAQSVKVTIPGYSFDIDIPIPSIPYVFSLYSPDSVWNKKLASAQPLSPNTAGFVAELYANQQLNGTWIETGPFATPIFYVDSNTPKVKVSLKGDITSPNALELLKGCPIPVNALPATGTDGHLCIIDKDSGTEYDFWQMKKQADGTWLASNAGIIHNISASDGTLELRNNGWNSATATHLPLAGGTITLKELQAGLIPHAICASINRPKKYPALVWPAKTTDGWYDGLNAIPEGQRFRFPANIVIDPTWYPITKMMVAAIRDYGMVVVDKTGAGVGFGLEDMRQYGVTDGMAELKKYMGGKEIWDVLGTGKQFPWDKLQALA